MNNKKNFLIILGIIIFFIAWNIPIESHLVENANAREKDIIEINNPQNINKTNTLFKSINNNFENPENTVLDARIRKEDENLVFSGILKTTENIGIEQKNIHLQKILEDENKIIKQVQTIENGEYSLSTSITENKGIFMYEIIFEGDNNYKNSTSTPLYYNSLDMIEISIIPLIIIGILTIIIIKILKEQEKNLSSYKTYAIALLVGLAIYFFLGFLIAGFIGGGIIGYYYLANTNWPKKIKIGLSGGIAYFNISIIIQVLSFAYLPTTIEGNIPIVPTTLTQTEFIQTITTNTLITGIIITTITIIGAILAGIVKESTEEE